jgi:hypothetical protein
LIIFTLAVLSGIVAVLTLDTIGSLLSKRLGFFYGRISPISLLLWTAAGALASRAGTALLALFLGVLAGLMVGLVDSTVGWWISWRIGPGRLRPERATPHVIAWTIVRVTIMAACFGGVGAAVLTVSRFG